MILGLFIATGFCLWLIVFGLFQSIPEPLQQDPTYISSVVNNTVIFIVLDAFRYDYSTRFPFFNRILQQYPKNYIHLKMLSSAPTMTTQKLQVMMSGHEMSSKNIIQNFMAQTTTQDNILKYVSSMSIGDDTWPRLYNMQKSISCESFVVSDLHSCDKLVIENLISEYKSQKYQMIIGHFLGLDHIGHTFSSVSTAHTTYKLNQISTFLNKVVDQMDQKTTLIVLGDHGMKSDGNHGGGSKQEIQTVFFAFSKTEMLQQQPRQICFQNDITPTLSVLLNVPVPINSLGNIIYSALPANKDLDIDAITNKVKSHIGRALKRMKVQYEEGRQIQVAREVKAHINLNLIVIAILGMVSALLWMILKLKLSITEVMFAEVFQIVNFSWFLLRNQQSYLQILLLMVFLYLTLKSQKSQIFIDSIITIFLLCQFQPHRKDEYNNSIFHLDFLNYFFQNAYLLMGVKLYLLYQRTKKLSRPSRLQIMSKVLMFLNIVMYEINQQLLCAIKSIQFVLLFVMLFLRQQNKTTVIESLILIFSGKKGIVMFALSDTLKLNLKESGTLLPYLNYYISEAIWLGEGNRADFSTTQILPSYIFTTQFIPLLNFLCLTIHQMCPYLHFLQQLQLSTRLQHILNEQQEDSGQLESPKQRREVMIGWDTHLKYLLVPGIGVVFSLICLLMNVGKILFTVVYLPLCFFCILKLSTLLVFIIIRYVVTKLRLIQSAPTK